MYLCIYACVRVLVCPLAMRCVPLLHFTLYVTHLYIFSFIFLFLFIYYYKKKSPLFQVVRVSYERAVVYSCVRGTFVCFHNYVKHKDSFMFRTRIKRVYRAFALLCIVARAAP